MSARDDDFNFCQYEIEELYKFLEQDLDSRRREAILNELASRLKISLKETVSQVSSSFVADTKSPINKNLLEMSPSCVSPIKFNAQDSDRDDLSSQRGVNYIKLQDFLNAKNWKDANEETWAVMLKVTGRESEDSLDTNSINGFPCSDLRTIDKLWVRYSNGHFGFSVQKQIFIECVGTPGTNRFFLIDEWKSEKFYNRLGWLTKGWNSRLLSEDELTFDISAPQGHLPYFGRYGFLMIVKRAYDFEGLLSKLIKCGI